MSRNDEKFTELIETLALEKNVPQEVIFSALELALAAAMAKEFPAPQGEDEDSINRDAIDIYVTIDRKTGERKAFRRWNVVADRDYRVIECERPISEVIKLDSNAKIGDVVTEELDNLEHCRIGAQTAKQQIYQKIREAERKQLMDEFLLKDQKMIVGAIKRQDKMGNYTVEFGKVEGVLPKENLLPKDSFKQGDKIKAYLHRIDRTNGVRLILSRTCNEFLVELFRREVPEIERGQIEIKAVAREPGVRAKIAVVSHDRKINSFGPCIGVKRLRINAIKRELGNEENIDIIEWHEDIKKFVMSALSPAEISEISHILVHEDKQLMEIGVKEEQYQFAIGKEGQNVRLASELTGWRLSLMTEGDFLAKKDAELISIREVLVEELNISEDIADLLARNGIFDIEELAYLPVKELTNINGLNEEIVNDLRAKALEKLAEQKRVHQDKVKALNPDVLKIDGMDEAIAIELFENGVKSISDVADLATFELLDLLPKIDENQAKKLILSARKLEENSDN